MKLEVGTIIYSDYLDKFVITRVTDTQAICEIRPGVELKFNREQHDPNHFYVKGKWDYGMSSYSIETEELKTKRHRKLLVARVMKIDFAKLPDSKLQRILEIAIE